MSTRRMIEGALRFGFTQTEIMEIGSSVSMGSCRRGTGPHSTANTVFRSPEFAQTDDPGL